MKEELEGKLAIKFSVKDQDYELGGDSHQFILRKVSKEINPKTGKKNNSVIGYYKSLDLVLADIFNIHLYTADVDSFRALGEEARKLNEILAEMKDMLKFKG
jgi:hypothetical protein